MPIYIMFSKLTDEGRATIKRHPERIKEAVVFPLTLSPPLLFRTANKLNPLLQALCISSV